MVAFQGKQAALCPLLPGSLNCHSIPHPESSRKVCGSISFLLEAVAFEDGQPVVLEDGSMAFIHRTAKGKALPALSLAEGEKLLKCIRFPDWGS